MSFQLPDAALSLSSLDLWVLVQTTSLLSNGGVDKDVVLEQLSSHPNVKASASAKNTASKCLDSLVALSFLRKSGKKIYLREKRVNIKDAVTLDTETQARFNQFWDTFNYKINETNAKHAWSIIETDCKKDLQVGDLMRVILDAASKEAESRPKSVEPLYPQAWLMERSWEKDIAPRETVQEHAERLQKVNRKILGWENK